MTDDQREHAEPVGKTLRQDIIELLKKGSFSLKEISNIMGITEKEAVLHLDHIKKSLSRSGYSLEVTPAVCRSCGFSFKKRGKLKKPGRCPVCKSTFIVSQIFTVKKR